MDPQSQISNRRSGQMLHFIFFHPRAPTGLEGYYDPKTEILHFFFA